MFDFGDLVLAFILGGLAVAGYVWWLFKRVERKIQRAVEKISNEIESQKQILLRVELDQDQFLCYNVETDQFVCQGSNVKEIFDRFKQRFPESVAKIIAGDEQAIARLIPQLEEYHENRNRVRPTP